MNDNAILKQLFDAGWTRVAIAEELGKNESTVRRWASYGGNIGKAERALLQSLLGKEPPPVRRGRRKAKQNGAVNPPRNSLRPHLPPLSVP